MKWLVRGAIALVVLIALAFVAILVLVNPALRKGVETGGTYALGVETTLADARLGLFSGELELGDLNVANPAGFQTSHFLALDEAKTQVNVGSLLSDEVVVSAVELDGIDVNLEKLNEKANYAVILENLKRLSGPDEPAEDEAPDEEPEAESEGKKFVIERLDITNVNVHARWQGKDIDVAIAKIPLKDVGSESDGGVLLSQLSGIIVKAILDAIAKNATDLIPAALLSELNDGLAAVGKIGEYTAGAVQSVVESGEKVLQEATKDATEAIGKASESVNEAITEGTEDLGKEVDKISEEVNKGVTEFGKGLKDALGGKKKDN